MYRLPGDTGHRLPSLIKGGGIYYSDGTRYQTALWAARAVGYCFRQLCCSCQGWGRGPPWDSEWTIRTYISFSVTYSHPIERRALVSDCLRPSYVMVLAALCVRACSPALTRMFCVAMRLFYRCLYGTRLYMRPRRLSFRRKIAKYVSLLLPTDMIVVVVQSVTTTELFSYT